MRRVFRLIMVFGVVAIILCGFTGCGKTNEAQRTEQITKSSEPDSAKDTDNQSQKDDKSDQTALPEHNKHPDQTVLVQQNDQSDRNIHNQQSGQPQYSVPVSQAETPIIQLNTIAPSTHENQILPGTPVSPETPVSPISPVSPVTPITPITPVNPVTPDTSKYVVIADADGRSPYTVIRGKRESSAVVNAAFKLEEYFKKSGITLKSNTDTASQPDTAYEILIGKTNRETDDFFKPDRELLGEYGYVIAVVNNKIFLAGGSDNATVAAVEKFWELWQDGTAKALPTDFQMYFNPFTDIDKLTVAGISIDNFKIVSDMSQPDEALTVSYLRSAIFEHCGIVVDTASQKSADDPVILLERSTESKIFSIKVSSNKIIITYPAGKGIDGIVDFSDKILGLAKGTLTLNDGYCFEEDFSQAVFYEDFGAVGDGITDDFNAIVAAHDYANKNNLRVYALPGATYYIGGANQKAEIQTDTVWSEAKFIIDDSNAESRSCEVFLISSVNKGYNVNGVTSLSIGQTNLGVTFESDCVVSVKDSNTIRYIRNGGTNSGTGSPQQEMLRVSKNGDIDPNTPVVWDYNTITSITASPIDDVQLRLHGGEITTIANRAVSGSYYSRGIKITRSNVCVDALTHYVTDNTESAPYNGILMLNGCSDITIRNTVLTGRIYNGMGTYDILLTSAVNVDMLYCRQTNSINDYGYWGIFGSNYSKNIVLDNCSFSRVDAHTGVTNITVRNCELGYQCLSLTGGGTALIENTTITSPTSFIYLRTDYGSTWNGNLIIRNCTFIPTENDKGNVPVISGYNDGKFDFGYTCYLPKNIIIDGLFIKDIKGCNDGPYLFGDINPDYPSEGAQFPIVITENVTVSGLASNSGKDLIMSPNKEMFSGLQINY